MDAGVSLEKIQKPVYEIWHSEGTNPTQIDTSLEASSQIVLLTDTINGVPPGNYVADRYYVTNTYQHSVASQVQILDGWPRYSGTNGFPDDVGLFPQDNAYMDGFELNVSGNTATVELSTYAMFIGGTINKWIPDTLPQLKLPFSLHLFDSTLVGIESVDVPDEIETLIYPNPSSNMLNIELSTSVAGNLKIQMLNSLGQVIDKIYDGRSVAGSQSFSLSCKNLANGTYFITMSLDDYHRVEKFTVYH